MVTRYAVAATSEPSSLALVGTGIPGMASMLKSLGSLQALPNQRRLDLDSAQFATCSA